MPAGVWAVPFAVGGRAHSRESELAERVSKTRTPRGAEWLGKNAESTTRC